MKKHMDVIWKTFVNFLIWGTLLNSLSCIDLLLINKPHSFCNTYLTETGLSDFHKTTLPSKHSSWWRTYWRRLEDVFSVTFFCLPRRLEEVLKTSCRHNCKTSWKHVLKTSWRRLQDVLGRRIANTSWRSLQDVLEDEKCYAEDVFKMSWRRLGKQEIFAGLLYLKKN